MPRALPPKPTPAVAATLDARAIEHGYQSVIKLPEATEREYRRTTNATHCSSAQIGSGIAYG
jgi:hypothetical protein